MMKYLGKIGLLFLSICLLSGCSEEDSPQVNFPPVEDYPKESFPYLYLEQGRVLEIEGSETVRAVQVLEKQLYVTNKSAKQVEVYSAEDLSKQTLTYGAGGLDCCSGYAVDSLVFVTSTNSPCQVSVFHKETGAYFCRLGNGVWWGPVVHPYSVAASSKYVFVWTQGPVQVFNRADMEAGKTMPVWTTLDTETIAGWNNNYSGLTVDGDTCLYVLSGDRGRVMYTYDLRTDFEQNVKVPFVKKDVLASEKPYGLAFGNRYVYASLAEGNKNQLRVYEKKKFVENPTLSDPLLVYERFPDGSPFLYNRTLAAKGDTIYLPQSQNKICELIMGETPIDVIVPSDKK